MDRPSRIILKRGERRHRSPQQPQHAGSLPMVPEQGGTAATDITSALDLAAPARPTLLGLPPANLHPELKRRPPRPDSEGRLFGEGFDEIQSKSLRLEDTLHAPPQLLRAPMLRTRLDFPDPFAPPGAEVVDPIPGAASQPVSMPHAAVGNDAGGRAVALDPQHAARPGRVADRRIERAGETADEELAGILMDTL